MYQCEVFAKLYNKSGICAKQLPNDLPICFWVEIYRPMNRPAFQSIFYFKTIVSNFKFKWTINHNSKHLAFSSVTAVSGPHVTRHQVTAPWIFGIAGSQSWMDHQHLSFEHNAAIIWIFLVDEKMHDILPLTGVVYFTWTQFCDSDMVTKLLPQMPLCKSWTLCL